MLSFDECTDSHYKMIIFCMWFCRFYLCIHLSFHLELYLYYTNSFSTLQINLQTPNPHQIIAVFFQNADGRLHVEQYPLINRSTMMAAAPSPSPATVPVIVAATTAAAAMPSPPTLPPTLPPPHPLSPTLPPPPPQQ